MFSKKFQPSERKYGILLIPSEYRDLFPGGSEIVTILLDGVEFKKKMHKKYSRIDGVTKEIHKKYETSITDTITYDVTDGYVKLTIKKQVIEWTEDEYNSWLGDAYPMNGEEIAEALNYSRQNVSQLLKRSLSKCYSHLVKTLKDMTSFEIAALMARMFNVGVNPEEESEAEVRKFFKLFPANIRRKVKKDATEKFGIM
jgi:predicted DNA-binding protein YlxM (UPF0122 family)